jgi:hypothetical protein
MKQILYWIKISELLSATVAFLCSLVNLLLTTRNSFSAPGVGGSQCALDESIIPTDAFVHQPTPEPRQSVQI